MMPMMACHAFLTAAASERRVRAKIFVLLCKVLEQTLSIYHGNFPFHTHTQTSSIPIDTRSLATVTENCSLAWQLFFRALFALECDIKTTSTTTDDDDGKIFPHSALMESIRNIARMNF
jgi:hypothetical protein